ncbi:MAG: DUF2759 domain-containing protein [Bacillaceae bacterium]
MPLMIILGLVAIISLVGFVKSLKSKNVLGAGFSFASVAVFGWFVVMTLLNSGFPKE